MNNLVEPVNLVEPAELSFSERKGQGSPMAMDMIQFETLSAAVIYAVKTMHDSHRPRCMITTRCGDLYRWSEILTLFDHVKIAQQ